MKSRSTRPEFSDNRDGRTLARALTQYIDWLEEERRSPPALSVATGYFNSEGFALLSDRLERLEGVRLLLGAEPQVPPQTYWRKPGEPRGGEYNAQLLRSALQGNERGLRQDRDLLGFSPEVDATLQRLLDFLESGKIEVRRYERGFLHGKAFLFSDESGVLAGSSNFTRAGLVSNLELNLGHYQPSVVGRVQEWFEELWDEAVPYDLAELYEARFQPYDPYLIYLRVLFELYGDEIEEERVEGSPIRLTTFQTDGVFRAKRILDRYRGVIVADGVGLGKSFIGGEFLRQAVSERRQRALLVSPAALRDGAWDRFLNRHQLAVENLSYEQLRDDVQLGGERSNLKNPKDQYSLVVIDEAHAFRNPDTRQAQALRLLLQGDPPKSLVLLTATPVNNSLWDLYYLLTYFIGHDAVFADGGIPSLKDRFHTAQDQDPHDLRPDLLYDVLDRTVVRRTRHFVKRYYPNDTIVTPDGLELQITFPKPEVRRVDYDLEGTLPGFLADFAEALAADGQDQELSLARYWPTRYKRRLDPDDPDLAREGALTGLIRSGLLKRFESSVHAFAETAGRMAEANDGFLRALDAGYVPSPQAIDEWQEVDSDEAWEELLQETGSDAVSGYRVEELRADVAKDRDLLRGFEHRARAVTPDADPKLAALADELAEIAQQAAREGSIEEDVREKRKVLIFTYFEDTAGWIEDFLLDEVESDSRLEPFRGRIASATGSESRRGISRQAAVYGFAPRSTEAPPGRDQDRFDILIATDVLAEGMNLQQCRNIINFDLPWNPMRIVQRHGRIDRIGSPHNRVFMRCFFPDRHLDELLDLELRVRRKLAQAAASIGLESEVIPGAATADINFSETRNQIEALRREEEGLLESGGEAANAHSGEEYRQELRQGLIERGDEVRALPWGAGSGFVGERSGHFFCARVGDEVRLRFVPLDFDGAYDGGPEIEGKTLSCLRMVTCDPHTERRLDDAMRERAYAAWEAARRDIYEEWRHATDPANLQPRIRPLFRQIAEHLRRHPPASLNQDELREVLESVEAPWGMRQERALRDVWKDFQDEGGEIDQPSMLSAALVEKVRELGLQPYQAPEPLPVIEEDEIKLVSWMAVTAEDGPGGMRTRIGEEQGQLEIRAHGEQTELEQTS